MKKILMSQRLKKASCILTNNLPGSTLKSNTGIEDPANHLDPSSYPYTKDFKKIGENRVNSSNYYYYYIHYRYNKWLYTNYLARDLLTSYVDYVIKTGDTLTPLYKANKVAKDIVDIEPSKSYPKKFESWDASIKDKLTLECGKLQHLRRSLLLWYPHKYHILKADATGPQYCSSIIHTLPEGLCFLYQLHKTIQLLLDPDMVMHYKPWKPLKTPNYEFQLYLWKEYRISHLKGRKGWRLVCL